MPSRKKPPVGPESGRVAAQTTLAAPASTGGQQHVVTKVGELAAHLAADPAIAPGNQRYGAHIVDCLHMM